MDPMDALVLKAIRENGGGPSHRDAIATKLKCSTDEVLVSFEHLGAMDCISFTDDGGRVSSPT
jgi:hypothetical protein